MSSQMPKNNSAIRNAAIVVALIAATFFFTYWQENRSINHSEFVQDTATDKAFAAAPDFAFMDTNKREHSLEDFRGKTVILNFWASWCAPCVKELPLLTRAAQENDNVVLIALSSDLDEQKMLRFLERYKHATAGDVFFAYDANMAITQDLYGTFRLPETYLIDAQGQIRRKIIGADWDYEDLLVWLKDLE